MTSTVSIILKIFSVFQYFHFACEILQSILNWVLSEHPFPFCIKYFNLAELVFLQPPTNV